VCGGQGNADGFVSIDTFFAKDHPAIAYRLEATLFRKVGVTSGPTLSRLSAIAMNLTNQKPTFPSPTTIRSEIDLHLPQYSQEIHHGDFPQYDNGGEAWCSPTFRRLHGDRGRDRLRPHVIDDAHVRHIYPACSSSERGSPPRAGSST
jgi:hypothetical protein